MNAFNIATLGLIVMAGPAHAHGASMDMGFMPGTNDSKGRYIPTDEERTEYQSTHAPWAWNVVYGYYALAVLSGILVIFTFGNALWRFRLRYKAQSGHIPTASKYVAFLRLLSYPQLPYRPSLIWIWAFGPLGPNIVLFAGLLFSTLITWVNQYYYRPPYYGSAPLCLRSEWIAMASLPFIFVLGAKRNLISLMTGVSHERLQVYHQGLAFNFVYMALVHSFACIITAYRDEGFIYSMNLYPMLYGSGFLAIGAFLVSFVGALPVFRKLFYETFWFIHVFVALLGIAALFWHGYKTLDSDAYMIATIVLFLSGVLWRLVMIAFHNPSLHVATLEPLDQDAIKLRIRTHTLRWSPGQHVFLRFTGLSPLEAHPFTIASIDEAVTIKNGVEIREMEFLVRPQRGFTRKLCDAARAGKQTFGVLVDGPYGSGGSELQAFEEVFVAAGGSGITWGLAVLKGLVNDYSVSGRVVRKVDLIWCVRSTDTIVWFAAELQAILKRNSTTFPVSVTIYVTDGNPIHPITTSSSNTASTSPSEYGSPGIEEKGQTFGGKAEVPAEIQGMIIKHGRPDLPTLVSEFVEQASGTVGVACCGPAGFSPAISNAVSRVQLDIIRGRQQNVSEVYLKSESYEW